jgi:hypothetical protein
MKTSIFFKIYCKKIIENTHWCKNLQNCSRNQFSVVVPRKASVKVSTSVGVKTSVHFWQTYVHLCKLCTLELRGTDYQLDPPRALTPPDERLNSFRCTPNVTPNL